MSGLEDQSVEIGESLIYDMGDNVNQFGQTTNVTIISEINQEFN